MGNQRAKDILPEMAEGWHGCLRNAVLENLEKLRVGELAEVRPRDNVRPTFATFSVQAVAPSAVDCKGLLRGGRTHRGFRPRCRAISVLSEGNCSS